ncbi:MAG: biotin transporter BioY [Acidimicrobiia bacterium]
MTTTTAPVLATRILPKSRVATVVAVVGFAALTALAAQVSFRIPPIEVPFTLQTAAVLLAGGTLGSKAGAASQMLYVLAGSIGLPVYAEQSSGVDVLTGPTGGYLVGFVIASYLVGTLAERRHDRQILSGFAAFLLGSLVIYAFGVIGLIVNLGLDLPGAIAGGVVPFVFWDIIKALGAGLLMLAAWKLVGEPGAR